ncbi:MAG TPA: hypothetical protein VHL80_12170 [Polyangia bacterium]|nr:hypothetical protein [Polyangia bacterium]
MQLRHISPGSSDWVDAMDEGGGGRGWEKLAPEERTKLRTGEYASVWGQEAVEGNDDRIEVDEDDYGWGEPSASR